MSQPQKLKPSSRSSSGVRRAGLSPFDSKAFAGLVVSDLKAPIKKIFDKPADHAKVLRIFKLVRSQLEQRLDQTMGAAERSAAAVPGKLPIEDLKPSEVIESGLVSMSQASLYRAVLAHKFYSVAPKGLSNGRAYPAWQFVDPVPHVLEGVLKKLVPRPARAIHNFLVSNADELNELSPAEVLAGKPMVTRGQLHASQKRLLSLPLEKRVQLVEAQVDQGRE